MTKQTTQNRVVEAVVHPESPEDGYRLKKGAEERGWVPVGLGQGGYRLAVPLYCARRAAVRACREELDEFSQSVVPLWIDEVRLRESAERDRRRVATARPSMKYRSDAFWHWLRGGAQWEVAVERAAGANPEERLKNEEARASDLLAQTRLGGPGLARPVRARLVMEPAQVQRDDMSLMGRALDAVKYFLPVAALLAIAVFAGNPTAHVGLRAALLLAGLAAAGCLGWWVTGSHAGRRRRWFGPAAGIGLFLYLFGLCFLAWQQRPPTPTDGWVMTLLRIGAALLIGFLLVRGWKHLHILRPGARSLWSFGALSFLITTSAALGSLAVWSLLRFFGLRAEDFRDWQMVSVFAALCAGLLALAVVVLAGAIRGWAEYYRLWFSKGAVSDLMWMATWPMVVVLAVLVALSFGMRLIGGVPVQLSQGQGPIFDLGLVDRVCMAVSVDDPESPRAREKASVSVIRGDGDRLRWWRADGEGAAEMAAQFPGGQFLPVASHDLVPAAAGACSDYP